MKLSDAKLWIATPNHWPQSCDYYWESMFKTLVWCSKQGIDVRKCSERGDSLVTRVRNVMVAQAFASGFDWTHFLFIDSDIEWLPEAIGRLISADKDVVCGVYPKKQNDKDDVFPINYATDTFEVGEDGIVELADAPTGFLMVKREVFERMMAAYPDRKCSFGPKQSDHELKYSFALFDTMIDRKNRRFLSEDFGFCRLWQQLGGRIHGDLCIGLAHWGFSRFYHGSPIEYLRDLSEEATGTKWGKSLTIQGWMTADELRWLAGMAEQVESVAEIGSWKGRSTYALGSMCSGPVYAIDTWLGSDEPEHEEARKRDIFADFTANTQDLKNVQPVKMKSQYAASAVPDVDMVFIDGGHTYEEVKADIEAWSGKAKKFLCGHDYTDTNHPGVRKAVDEAFGDRAKLAIGSIWIVDMREECKQAA
jgi:hypothetical protein